MGKRSRRFLRKIVRNWPFFDRFGFYSLAPLFFASGFGLELFMIKFKFYEHSFYRTFNRTRLEELKAEIEEQENIKRDLLEKLNDIAKNKKN